MSRTKDNKFMMNSFILTIGLFVWMFFHDNIRFSISEEKSNYVTSDGVLSEINYNYLDKIFGRK